MNKLKSFLNPDVSKLILENFPIIKKRTPYWFFTREVKKNAEFKLNKNDVSNLWNKMDPESKRLYFTMAEFDEVRYKEQKSLRLAEIGSLLAKHGNEMSKLSKSVSSIDINQQEFLNLLDKYQKNYGKMIQAESTNKLYKNVIDKNDQIDLNITAEKLISAVPEDFRTVLSKPRRPSCPFALFTWHKRDELMKLKSETNSKLPFLRLASQEWSKLNECDKAYYQDKYNELLEEYKIAMDSFKKKNSGNSNEDYLEQASKEKKAFRKSLRKRLRDYGVVPINVRNAFNFYLMDNKDIPLNDLTKIWRSLPEEKKLKYKKMHEEDTIRYYNEKLVYQDFITNLNKLMDKRKIETNSTSKQLDTSSSNIAHGATTNSG